MTRAENKGGSHGLWKTLMVSTDLWLRLRPPVLNERRRKSPKWSWCKVAGRATLDRRDGSVEEGVHDLWSTPQSYVYFVVYYVCGLDGLFICVFSLCKTEIKSLGFDVIKAARRREDELLLMPVEPLRLTSQPRTQVNHLSTQNESVCLSFVCVRAALHKLTD